MKNLILAGLLSVALMACKTNQQYNYAVSDATDAGYGTGYAASQANYPYVVNFALMLQQQVGAAYTVQFVKVSDANPNFIVIAQTSPSTVNTQTGVVTPGTTTLVAFNLASYQVGNNFNQYINQNGSVYFMGLTQNADGSFTCKVAGCSKFGTGNQPGTFTSDLSFEKVQGSGKDLDKARALVESMQSDAMAQNIAANFGLSYDRSVQIAKMAQSWNKLSKTRAMTDADADGVIQKMTGVTGEAMKSAETAMIQYGNHAPMDAILNTAAQVNGTTSENMSAIMNQLFINE